MSADKKIEEALEAKFNWLLLESDFFSRAVDSLGPIAAKRFFRLGFLAGADAGIEFAKDIVKGVEP